MLNTVSKDIPTSIHDEKILQMGIPCKNNKVNEIFPIFKYSGGISMIIKIIKIKKLAIDKQNNYIACLFACI